MTADDARRAYFRAWHDHDTAKQALAAAKRDVLQFPPGEGQGVRHTLALKRSEVDWQRLYEDLGLSKEQFDAKYRLSTGEMISRVSLIR